MNLSIMKKGQTCLLVSLCILAAACNPDEFFPTEEFLTGEDAYCYEAKDLDSCQAKADRCQPAYVESKDETQPLEFVLCLANPNPEAVDDGSSAGGTDETSDDGSNDESVQDVPGEIPSLQDAIASKCQNLSSEYLWEKTEMKKGKVFNKVSKVKVCHMTGNGSAHTLVIACPALKAHTKHQQQEDYLGACF